MLCYPKDPLQKFLQYIILNLLCRIRILVFKKHSSKKMGNMKRKGPYYFPPSLVK